MSQIQLIQVLCYFRKNGNTLTLTKWINKDWFPDDSSPGPFQLGLHRVERDQLNQVRITFEDKTKLQCVLFHKEDEFNYQYGTREFIRKQLMQLTGSTVRMTRILNRGRSKPDLMYIPLRDSREYELFFSQYDHLREFRTGNVIAEVTFQNGMPEDLPLNAETLIITDSFLENLEFLKRLKDLKSLFIERCVVADWESIRDMENLENLHIETAEIPDSTLVGNLSKIKRLGLVDCALVEVEGLAGKADLIFCDLSNNRNLSSVDALKSSRQLQWLVIEYANIRKLDLLPWDHLTILEIPTNCMITIKNLHHCQELKLMDYTFNWFDESVLMEIHHLGKANQLIAFDLCGDFYLTEGLN